MQFRIPLACCSLGIGLLLFIGCAKPPPQGTVHGTVTLNGEPVDGGLIRMVPVEADSQPADTIISQGKYELTLAPGKKKVELTWSKDAGVPDTASQGTVPPPKELFPPQYNSQTTLEYEVMPGRTEKNWEIKHP